MLLLNKLGNPAQADGSPQGKADEQKCASARPREPTSFYHLNIIGDWERPYILKIMETGSQKFRSAISTALWMCQPRQSATLRATLNLSEKATEEKERSEN